MIEMFPVFIYNIKTKIIVPVERPINGIKSNLSRAVEQNTIGLVSGTFRPERKTDR